jgi:hypothetical protein
LLIGGNKKLRIPFPGKDYDIHGGVQSNLIFREIALEVMAKEQLLALYLQLVLEHTLI